MKLLIVSHTAHYYRDGKLVGWGPTIREIDHLAHLFDEIRHVAFLHEEPAPDTSLPYSSKNISFFPVQPSGGLGLRKKLGILSRAPEYVRVINSHLDWADMVHVRCAANISLMALLLLGLVKKPQYRWTFYAGNWFPNGKDPWAFALQRWLLRKDFVRGLVTVNGEWPQQLPHIVSCLNPCLTEQELETARRETAGKQFCPPYEFLFAGWIENRKGAGRALDIVAELNQAGIPVTLNLVGDGADRVQLEQKASELGMSNLARFHGWINRSELNALYAKAHFLLIPSEREGFPKVLSEAMAYGVIPIASTVGGIQQTLSSFQTGVALPVEEHTAFVRTIVNYIENPSRWHEESKKAIAAAGSFTYNNYLDHLESILHDRWQIVFNHHAKS
jgi:glycosyltransferase involved in cell wall biosynthesis